MIVWTGRACTVDPVLGKRMKSGKHVDTGDLDRVSWLSSGLRENARLRRDYFVGQPSRKVCVFSTSVDFFIIFNINISRKDDGLT